MKTYKKFKQFEHAAVDVFSMKLSQHFYVVIEKHTKTKNRYRIRLVDQLRCGDKARFATWVEVQVILNSKDRGLAAYKFANHHGEE